MSDTQYSLTFHDTVPLPEDKLPKARERAQSQKETILRLFEKYPDRWFSPYEMMDIYTSETGRSILITSVRRSITDLTKGFKLVKGGKGEQVDEINGSPNNRWKLATPGQEYYLKNMGLANASELPKYPDDVPDAEWNKLLNESI